MTGWGVGVTQSLYKMFFSWCWVLRFSAWLHIIVNPGSIYVFSVNGDSEGLRKIFGSVLFLFTLCFPGMGFRSSGLVGQVSLPDELSCCTH